MRRCARAVSGVDGFLAAPQPVPNFRSPLNAFPIHAIITVISTQLSEYFPTSKREDRANGEADGFRRRLPLAGAAACAAEGVSPRPQFWFPASQLQAPDRAAAFVAEVRSTPGIGVSQGPRAHRLHLLWRSDEDRADADSVDARGSADAATCRAGCALIVEAKHSRRAAGIGAHKPRDALARNWRLSRANPVHSSAFGPPLPQWRARRDRLGTRRQQSGLLPG